MLVRVESGLRALGLSAKAGKTHFHAEKTDDGDR